MNAAERRMAADVREHADLYRALADPPTEAALERGHRDALALVAATDSVWLKRSVARS